MENHNTKKLSHLLRARFPYIYIATYEEDRATKFIKEIVKDKSKIKYPREVFIWTQATGLRNEDKVISNTTAPNKLIEYITNYDKDSIFILYDFHVFFGNKQRPADPAITRSLRDLIPTLKTSKVRKNIIFISPDLNIPESLQKDIVIYDFPLPKMEEIKSRLNKLIVSNQGIDTSNLSEEDKEKLCKAALGLTMQEAESAFALAMVNDGKLNKDDISIILEEKMQVIRKTGMLEYIQSDMGINDIGGLDNLKKWLLKRNNSWSEKAKKYCIPAPKGVLVTGVPGCGKSLTAKAMSTIWQLPLLRLDLGKIFSGIVGSSEENMRKAISTVEAVAPAILWVDEVEKGLNGVSSGNDSGVSSRVFGTFLTWMQEKTAPVFVIATANNIDKLPPELLRKGRFDEIFFVDLPTFNERKEIFRVHLLRRLKDAEICAKVKPDDNKFIEHLAGITEGFIGSEIEQVVISALCDAFFEDRALEPSDFEKAVNNTVPLSKTQREQILAIREWANIRAVSASSKENTKEYTKIETEIDDDDNDKDDITSSRGGRRLDV
ncbi:MAG: AAA family ATPase [Candidatus Gastranaerophilales bacterium]|nr:AAA family ATPase [Candidatus Gastranaerophilales bacterium]